MRFINKFCVKFIKNLQVTYNMSFLNGTTFKERRKHLASLVKANKLGMIQRKATMELEILLDELTKMQQEMEGLEKEKNRINSALSDPGYQKQWEELRKQKIQIEEKLKGLIEGELKECRELISDLQDLKNAVKAEEAEDREAA